MQSIRKRLRRWLAAFAALLVLPIANLNIERLAEEKGWDNLLTGKWGWFVSSLSQLATEPLFLVLFGFVLGATAWAWGDYYLRQYEHKQASSADKPQPVPTLEKSENQAKSWPETPKEEIPEKISAINDLLEIFGFDKILHQQIKRTRELIAQWNQQETDDALLQYRLKLNSLREECEDTFREIREQIQKNEKYPDIQELISRGGKVDEMHSLRFIYSISVMHSQVGFLGAKPTANHQHLFKPTNEECRQGIIDSNAWRERVVNDLLKMRLDLLNKS